MDDFSAFLTSFEADKGNVRILRAAYIHGPPGSGKSTLVRAALRANGYDIIEHSATEERAKNLVDLIVEKSITTRNVTNMFKRTPSKKVILIDDVDCITDKGGISMLIKFIRPKKTNTQRSEFVTPFPIVLIGNTCADKKIKDLVKSCFTLQIPTPSRDRMLSIIAPSPFADTILRLSNGNLHKLLKLSKLITSPEHVTMFETAHVTETSKTFTARLFLEPIPFDDHFNLNETDRTIVSMLWHENVIDVTHDSRVYVQLLNNMCFADYIDRITFQRQIWQFNQLSSLIKTFYNNWLLHQHMKIPHLKEIRFTKILTKYSTEYNNTLFIQKLCRTLLIDISDLFKLITSMKSQPPSAILEALHGDDISLGDVTRLVRFLD